MAYLSDITTTPTSGLNHIDALLDRGPDWNYLTPVGNVIRYTFSVSSGNEASQSGQQAFSASQQANARAAMNYISSVTGISFVETQVGTDAQVHLCSINIAAANTTGLCSWNSNYTYNPSDSSLVSYNAQAYVYLDNAEWGAQNANLTPGTAGYETLLHELGHMLGLKHPFEDAIRLPAAQDNTGYTLMAYNDAGGPHTTFSEYDIAALNWLYGADGLRGQLGMNSNSGARFVTGSAAGDTLTGTAGGDVLEGKAGNDTINGGAGNDTAVFSGNYASYVLTELNSGNLQVSGQDGVDTLNSVETLRFADQTVQRAANDITAPPAPTLNLNRNANGFVSGNTPNVTGNAEANAKVDIYSLNNVVATTFADASGFYSVNTSQFPQGTGFSIYARATDAAGNVSPVSSSISFSVDTTAPVAPTVSVSFPGQANMPVFSGTGEVGSLIKLTSGAVDIGSATVGANGTWSVASNGLANAGYSVVATSYDKADNATSSPNQLQFTVNFSTSVSGSSGADLLAQTAGNNTIDGGAGRDSVIYGGVRSNYEITKGSGGYVVTAKTGGDGVDTLLNVETIQFADRSLSVEYDAVVQALYVAYFGRAADYNGLANFQSQLSALNAPLDFSGLSAAYGSNTGIRNLIDSFGTSNESAALYPSDTTSFVIAVYQNVFGRNPAESGLNFWSNAINSGSLTKANASLSIMAGALQNTTSQGVLDAQRVNNKITVASDFSLAIDTANEIAGYAGQSAAASVRSLLSSVTATTNIDQLLPTIRSTLAAMSGGQSGSQSDLVFAMDSGNDMHDGHDHDHDHAEPVDAVAVELVAVVQPLWLDPLVAVA